MDAIEAVRGAQEYTWRTLAKGFRPGMGQHIPDRFFWARSHEADVESGPEPEPSSSAPANLDEDT
jgi:hydroxymethylpyrimidine/phosphomethylpyrimidine kinase